MPNPYARDVSHIKTLDPYRLQELYKMHPCAEHVVKKLLVAGEREGGKDLDHDISDCIRTLTRWQEMRKEDRAEPAKALTRYDWTKIPVKFSWAAQDCDGQLVAYARRPKIDVGDEHWSMDADGPGLFQVVASSNGFACPAWANSLERRP